LLKSIVGLKRRLYGISDELRRSTRHELLEATPLSVKQAAAELKEGIREASRVVFADEEKLSRSEELFKRVGQKRLVVPM